VQPAEAGKRAAGKMCSLDVPSSRIVYSRRVAPPGYLATVQPAEAGKRAAGKMCSLDVPSSRIVYSRRVAPPGYLAGRAIVQDRLF